jgi:hypothetical protein
MASSGLLALCGYLEMINSELDLKILETQSDVAKMQEIAEAMRPAPSSEPKENAGVGRLINLERGIEAKDKPDRPAPLDPFAQFEEALAQFNNIKALHRDQYARRFLANLSSYTRKTMAHSLARLVPCARRLNQEFDRILAFDLDQLSAGFRAKLVLEKSPLVIEGFEKEIADLGLSQQLQPPAREKTETHDTPKPQTRPIPTHFETIAKLSEKQLSNLYQLRGTARKELILARMREKIDEIMVPLLENEGNDEPVDDIGTLKLASQAFVLLSTDPRRYALVSDV